MPSGSSFNASSLRSTPTTVNPAAASFCAVARPSSPPAPTTIATRSLIPPPPWNRRKRVPCRFFFPSLRVQVHRWDGERSSPDSGDLQAIYGQSYADRVPGGDGAMTDISAADGHAVGAPRQGLIDRHDLIATLDHAA